jgi:hypothetical protein
VPQDGTEGIIGKNPLTAGFQDSLAGRRGMIQEGVGVMTVSTVSRGAPKSAYLTAEIGHVWTAPWEELSNATAAWAGCGRVSGLLMRRKWALP